jgi:hypothetical protein
MGMRNEFNFRWENPVNIRCCQYLNSRPKISIRTGTPANQAARPKGAHLLLQMRTKVLNNELDDVFRRWYPKFRSVTQPATGQNVA